MRWNDLFNTQPMLVQAGQTFKLNVVYSHLISGDRITGTESLPKYDLSQMQQSVGRALRGYNTTVVHIDEMVFLPFNREGRICGTEHINKHDLNEI